MLESAYAIALSPLPRFLLYVSFEIKSFTELSSSALTQKFVQVTGNDTLGQKYLVFLVLSVI